MGNRGASLLFSTSLVNIYRPDSIIHITTTIQATVEWKDNQWMVIAKEWLERLLLSDDSGRFEKQGFPVRVMLYQPKICTSASCLRAPGMWTAWNSNFFSIRFSPWRKEEGRSSKNMYKGPFPTTQIFMYEVFRLKITGACLYQL